MAHSRLTTWTIYDHPTDYPKSYVAREWVVEPGQPPRVTENVMISDDIEKLREVLLVDLGLNLLGPFQEDDPTIVETWL